MSGHLHTFDVPLSEDEPHARRCACGEPQRYKAPTGQPVKFTDVLVEIDDLRALFQYIWKDRHSAYALAEYQIDAMYRVKDLLDG